MIDEKILNLDVSKIKDSNQISRDIIKHIYAIRNYYLDKDIQIKSIFISKFMLEYLKRYNFVFMKKIIDIDNIEDMSILGYLIDLIVVYSEKIENDQIVFNTEDKLNILNIKIKF